MANEVINQKDITDQVSSRIKGLEQDGLQLPANYNANNALKAAWFTIQKVQDKNRRPALEVVTRESVANSLLNMVTQGLSPAKTQAYFIVRGNELQLQRSYFGTQAAVKRLTNVDDIWAEVIHEDDTFEIGADHGRTVVAEFKPKFANQDKPLIGAFAVVKKTDGEQVYTVMTKAEIEQAWSHRQNHGDVQKEFPQEMAKRTVINRAAKNFLNTSDDSDLLVESINDTTSDEYDNDKRKDITPAKESKDTQDLLNGFQDSSQSQQSLVVSQASQSASTSANSVETSVSTAEDIINDYEQSQSSKGDETVDKEKDVHQGDIFNQADNPHK
ncbi:recombinase RecT [Furfurilactobacillus siliginis]|uniref:DNA recombination protein RecT n=1 Tax=Furfurilactobacillus siliginis TaxID=348151 RepID=A0A0R2LCG1_9LACO|nr:RecT family recombinase [Furfurilactobacillus siliginis]KRN96730.1 hypothetical protein IV55_GL001265 [Furfurilactobacillus siliginis]GEK28880.1 DNA recombination protein RecT [Furfurilactobacillus siliginis]